MGTKSEFVDECTKVKTAAEIDEMVRQARAQQSKSEDDDYEDFDGNTQVGNLQELVARTALDDDPPPVMPRASSNVLRKTSSHVVPRASGIIPVMAAGSHSDVMSTEPAPVDEDVAFEPWEEDQPKPPISAAFAALPSEHAAVAEEVLEPAPLQAPPVESLKAKTHWGAIAWVFLLVTTIGMGLYGYQRITDLEQQLAAAHAKR